MDDTFSEEIAFILKDERVILEVFGFTETSQGDVFYDMKMIDMDEEHCFRWLLSDQDLKESFYYLGNNYQKSRFLFIDV